MAFNIDYTVCIIIMAVLTGVYVIAGGYMATAINDFIQGIIMLVGIVAVIAAVLKTNGGFMAAYQGLTEVPYEGMKGQFASFFGPDPLNLLGVVILTSLGTWGLPQMVQKFYAIKSEKDIAKGTIISTFFAIVVAGGCYFLGGFGRLFSEKIGPTEAGTPVGGFDAVVPAMLEGLSPLLLGVIVILVLSASMSTLSSLVLASSSTLTLDFLKDNFIHDMDEKKQVFIMRLLIVVFILISVVIAIIQYSTTVNFIAQLMGISWGALAGAFLAPFLYGLYMKKATKRRRLVQHDLRRGHHGAEHAGQAHVPGVAPVPDQLRRLRHDRRPGDRARGQPVHAQAREGPGGFRLRRVRPKGGRLRQGFPGRQRQAVSGDSPPNRAVRVGAF